MRWRVVLVAALCLCACDDVRVGPAPRERADPAPAPPPPDPGDAPCETLDRATCMRSLVCTLHAPSGRASNRYACVAASGNCEVGLRQIAEDRDRCDDRTGCRWRPAACYCACRGAGRAAVPDGPDAPDCDCDCAGGPPPGCVPRG